MRSTTIGAVSALAATCVLSTAWAETHVISQSGAWQVFGGTTTKGRPVCGMSSSGNGRYFGVKYFSGDDTITIQLGSGTWKIEDGAKQKLKMRLDNNSEWNATGTGMHFNDGDAGMEFTINRKELDEFMREFRASAIIRVDFTGSNAKPWTTSLAGTNAVATVFSNCVRDLK